MPKSTYLSNALLNAVLRDTPYTSPTLVYLALYTASPGVGGGGTEVSGGGYGRQSVTFTAPTTGSVHNASDITFPIALADWGHVVAFGVFNANPGGNLLYFADLSAPRDIFTNDQIHFPANQLVCSES